MLASVIKKFQHYLLLSDDIDTNQGIEQWRVSALRIMILAGYTLYTVIALHSSVSAQIAGFYIVLPITVLFYTFASIQLWLSARYYKASAYLLLFSIVAAAVIINTLVKVPTLAVLGPVFIFSLPLVGFILLGTKVGFICMLLNFIPYVGLLSGIQLNQFIDEHVLLEHASAYLISIIFIFFNICAPLAVARASWAAKRLNARIINKNAYLRKQKDFYRTLFLDTDVSLLLVCPKGNVIEANQAAEKLLQFALKELFSPRHVSELLGEIDLDDDTDKIINRSVAGKMKAFKVSRSALTNDGYRFLTILDVTAKIMLHKTLAAQMILNRQQQVDKNTGIGNRNWLETNLEQILAEPQSNVCLIAFKINNAQFIEQKFGAQNLPLLIKKLSEHWRSKAQNNCKLATVDKDNLTVVTDLSLLDAQEYIHSFISLLPKYILINEHSLPIDLKVGVAFSDSSQRNSEKLINNALYAVMSSHSVINVYETASLERFIEHEEINILLSEAMTNNELNLVYQPKVKGDGRLIGLEALLRWNSPIIGQVPPSIFIPIAEKSGLIPLITQWVITEVCKQVSEWQNTQLTLVPVAINISGPDLDHEYFHEHLVNNLVGHKIQPQIIELELTESARSLDNSKALATVRYLSNWGFCLTLDDFGIGYSGLSKLVSYPVQKVKIDRQFIKDIHKDNRKAKVVEAIIAMCKVFDIEVVGEGVEEFAEVDKLLLLGCTTFQGYVFSRPVPTEHATQILRAGNVFNVANNKSLTKS